MEGNSGGMFSLCTRTGSLIADNNCEILDIEQVHNNKSKK